MLSETEFTLRNQRHGHLEKVYLKMAVPEVNCLTYTSRDPPDRHYIMAQLPISSVVWMSVVLAFFADALFNMPPARPPIRIPYEDLFYVLVVSPHAADIYVNVFFQ